MACLQPAYGQSIRLTTEELKDMYSTINMQRTSVHDPSIVFDEASQSYYIFGSHNATAKTTDLQNWSPVTFTWGAVNADGTETYNVEAAEAFHVNQTKEIRIGGQTMAFGDYDASAWNCALPGTDNAPWSVYGNMWAPDIIYNPAMKKWCQYLSLNGPTWNSCIILLTADRIELAESLDGRLTWVVADGQEPQLFLLRGIREMQGPTLDTLATMLIEVDFPALVEQYRGAMTRLGSPLQCAIYRDGVCLYASNEAVSALQPGANGYTRMKLDGQDMLCVRYTGTDGMQYVTLVDYGPISRRVFAAVCITALVILAATVLAMVVSGWLTTNLLNHLQVLLEKFNDFAATGRPVLVVWRQALLKHFGSVKAIREATEEQLRSVVPRNTAQAVYQHFLQEEDSAHG